MAAITHSRKLHVMHFGSIQMLDRVIEKLLVRPCMVFSTGLILVGLSIPILMAAEFLPLSLGFGFLSLVLMAGGGISAFIFYGEP